MTTNARRLAAGLQTLIGVLFFAGAAATPAAAQPLGTFRWQLQPYCNVLTLAVTQVGSQYRFEGFDEQCGVARRAPVTGLGVPNPDGTLEFGLTIVTAPGPQHIDVTFHIASLGGAWQDNGGNHGTFVFNPGSVSGSPRPGGLGSVAIDPRQVQQRITGTCGASQFVSAVNQDGTVSCNGGAGDISGVVAGDGLTGGGSAGTVGLAVNFNQVATRQHEHEAGTESVVIGQFALYADRFNSTRNVAVGYGALYLNGTGTDNVGVGPRALGVNTTGHHNTAIGGEAMSNNVNGAFSVAVGAEALGSQVDAVSNVAVGYRSASETTSGGFNTAIGDAALRNNLVGHRNVAVGASALVLTTSNSNTAIGTDALADVTTGAFNIGIGRNSGDTLTTGSNNIYVGTTALAAGENNVTRIGAATQLRTFIGGIRGITTGAATAIPVLIDTNGQLGTISSSRRFKEDIADLGAISLKVQQLRPVQFRYTQPFENGGKPLQYGLIAEEVNEVMPELVVRSGDGRIETVSYHILPTLLLAEVQRLERERATLTDQVARQAREIADLRAMVDALAARR